MEKETQLSMKLYDTDLIQDGFLGTKWSNIDHELLSKGEMSTLKTLHMQDGSIQEGKISLIKDKDNEISVKFHLKKEKLIIPDKILDKELSEEEKLKLQNNTEILLNYKGEQVKVRVDKEINQVVVSGNKEITNVKELGEYKLSEREQEKLLSGAKLKPKVFKGEKGYFMSEVSLTDNKKGLVFSNTKQLDKETALEMMKTLNKDTEQDFLTGAFNTVSELKTNTTFEQKEETKLETKENLDVHMLASKLSDKDVEKPQELYDNVKNKIEETQEQPISKLAGNEIGGGNEWLENENRLERVLNETTVSPAVQEQMDKKENNDQIERLKEEGRILNDLLDKKDFEKINNRLAGETIMTEKQIADIVNGHPTITHQEKIATLTILNVDINTHLKNENGLTNHQERDLYREKQMDNQQQKTISKSSNMSM